MIQELELLKEYAKNHNINDLTSEDIVKLMTTPYIIEDIANAFNISVKEFNEIKKQKGVTNVILEDTIRNIEAILAYIDNQNIFISENIKKKIVDDFVKMFLINVPKKDFYIKKISEIDFTREKILSDIVNKNIDVEYRIKKLDNVISYIKEEIKILKEKEKNYFHNYNNQTLYKKLKEEKSNGKIFTKNDLTYDILFELAIIENIPDSLVADIFGLTINQLRYLRKKYNLSFKFKARMEKNPEIIMYGLEDNNMRNEEISNYQYQKIIENVIDNYHYKDVNNNKNDYDYDDEVTINIDGKDETYYVTFSNEKFSTNTKSSNRKHNGSHHNYKKENETKIGHGKRGEKIALEAEKIRLEKLGLYDVINDVELVAQIDEDTTFDGLGYDLISFNEFKERICIEVKTSYSKKDKPFFISKKELEILQGLKEEYNCQKLMIYYVLVDGNNVTIKTIEADDISTLNITPVLYKVG